MNFEKINDICRSVIFFYEYNIKDKHLYSFEIIEQLTKEYNKNIEYLDSLDVNDIFTKIDDINKYYYIYYYYYVINEFVKEDYEILLKLIEINKSSILPFNILMMNRELNDDTIIYLFNYINENDLYTGTEPFDYKYHILRRSEISDDVKNDILATFKKEDLKNLLNDIIADFNSECFNKNIIDIEQIVDNKELNDEYNSIKIIKKILNK